MDTTAAWKKMRFILSDRADFHMIERLSLAVHAFASRVLMSFLVDEVGELVHLFQRTIFSRVDVASFMHMNSILSPLT